MASSSPPPREGDQRHGGARPVVSGRTAPPLLEVRSVSKSFPGVQALNDVSFHLNRGEVLAVIGENGAGKSTLMKILAGVQQPDLGQVLIEGRPARLESTRAAMREGVVLIHQELNLAPNLDVAANLFLGREPQRLGWMDRRSMTGQARRLLERVGLDVPPQTLVGSLPIGRQQMVEIAKALSVDARVLIMDEPTSSLSAKETEALFAVVKDLRAAGVSMIYISHRLGEVRELADRVTVLRDGANAGELPRERIEHDAMVRLMVGREISQFYSRKPHPLGDVLLRVRDLRTPAWPTHGLSFSVRAGEIVGVAGLVGAGRSEVLQALFGIDRPLGGEVEIAGNKVSIRSPQDAIAAGLALVPEDRKEHGLVLEMSVRRNIGLAALQRHAASGGWLNFRREQADSGEMIERLRIRTPSDRQVVRLLSGGNQQKVVIGKWLTMQPRILLLDEPTRGIDVGAKEEIYRMMEQLAARGMAVLFVSSEMEEILGMSDRALVMHEGRLSGELTREQLSEEAVMHLATGGAS